MPQLDLPHSRILGTGHYLPEIVRTNLDLEKVVDTTDAWIVERTGIRKRHITPEGLATSDLAKAAGERALEAAGVSAKDLDMIVVATVTPDMQLPATAVFVQQKLGAPVCPAFDVGAACAGFIFGLSLADQFITTGAMKRVLVIGVEALSRVIDWSDRTTCVLFGDGAGAAVLGPAEGAVSEAGKPRGLLSTKILSDGTLAHSLMVPAGGSATPLTHELLESRANKVHMRGQDIFKVAVKNLYSASKNALESRRHDPGRGRLDLPAPGQPADHRRRCAATSRSEGQGPDQHRAGRQHVERLDPHPPRRVHTLRQGQAGGHRPHVRAGCGDLLGQRARPALEAHATRSGGAGCASRVLGVPSVLDATGGRRRSWRRNMRVRLGGLLAIASILTVAMGACKTAGVSAVYMSIDSAGLQRRAIFYTDSSAIYCIAKVSAARPDVTIDYTIWQSAIYPWCDAVAHPGSTDSNKSSIQPVFAVGEETPGVGVETVVAAELLSSGITLQTNCVGYCAMNLPSTSYCNHADGGVGTETAASCEAGYRSLGANSCGIGLTCCQIESTSSGSTAAETSAATIVPYPAGQYTCIVYMDGVNVGTSDFTIEYPAGNEPPSEGSAGCGSVPASACYCPVPPPVNGIPCYGWVPENAQCPGYIGQATCTCMPTGFWSCPQ